MKFWIWRLKRYYHNTETRRIINHSDLHGEKRTLKWILPATVLCALFIRLISGHSFQETLNVAVPFTLGLWIGMGIVTVLGLISISLISDCERAAVRWYHYIMFLLVCLLVTIIGTLILLAPALLYTSITVH